MRCNTLTQPQEIMYQTPVYTQISKARIEELAAKAAEIGARMYVVRRVHVRQDIPWNDALDDAITKYTGGYTACCDPRVSHQFQPVSDREEVLDIVLLNFIETQNLHRSALFLWEQKTGLQATHPREIYAVGKDFETLNIRLGYCANETMYLVAPTEGLVDDRLKFCFVEWTGNHRCVGIDLIDSFFALHSCFAYRERAT